MHPRTNVRTRILRICQQPTAIGGDMETRERSGWAAAIIAASVIVGLVFIVFLVMTIIPIVV